MAQEQTVTNQVRTRSGAPAERMGETTEAGGTERWLRVGGLAEFGSHHSTRQVSGISCTPRSPAPRRVETRGLLGFVWLPTKPELEVHGETLPQQTRQKKWRTMLDTLF